jgi:O-antigen ligase
MAMSFYLKKQLKLSWLIVIFIVLFIPTTLNETKASFVLLPMALMLPAVLMPKTQEKFKQMVTLMLIGVFALSAFVGVYNQFRQVRYAQTGGFESIVDFYTQEDNLKEYLYKTEDSKSSIHLGKIDSVILPIRFLSDDGWKLVFGVGIGNAAPSFMPGFTGKYAEESYLLGFGMTTIGDFIWEIGILGLFLYCLFLIFIFKDALHIGKKPGLEGSIGLGWAAVIIIMFLGLFYKSMFQDNAIGYLFWYFCGCIAFMKHKQVFEERSRVHPYIETGVVK